MLTIPVKSIAKQLGFFYLVDLEHALDRFVQFGTFFFDLERSQKNNFFGREQ